MAAVYDPGILGVKPPLKCGCQELLAMTDIVHYGWLRKRGLWNKLQINFLNWPQVYVIIAGKCLYYFKSETAKKPAGAVSLYGYNRVVRVQDERTKEIPWTFKLEHIQPTIRSLHFSAPSEKEMISWMKSIKTEMLIANNMKNRLKKKSADETSLASSWGSSDYSDIESSIYMEACPSRLSMFNDNPLEEEGSDKDDEDDGEESVYTTLQDDDIIGRLRDELNGLKVSDSRSRGYSLQRAPPPDLENYQVSKSYWDSVHFTGEKEMATEIIRSLHENGVYLVRKSEGDGDVLMVYADGRSKKYRIMKSPNGLLALQTNGPHFDTLEKLLYHHYQNPLPNTTVMLTTPYQQHSRYKD